ncbi:MAG: tetraacyldisaccharide 4'-kinase [Rhizobiales bacterium]|nr:tetraacyldisaccharide 4'-kinase [Hyphomicrobiales bacterium]
MRDPAFWWRPAGLAVGLLAPFAAAYGAIAARRMAGPGARAGVPVLCVGNFTLGGAGKTPTVLMLARLLQEAGERPFCLSRGYGGGASRPKRVDPHKDSAALVGDEALLLAQVAPTVVAHDRVAGAQIAKTTGASVIVMDDGLQNASLAKDFTLAVVDGRRGIGNGRVFPAGPLRAPLNAQLARTDALLVVGDDTRAREVIAAARPLPVWHGKLVPDAAAVAALKARKVFAFAGIGDPDKFFATVTAAGIAIARRRAFADHHRYSAEQAAELIMQAEHDGLALLTTAKDCARMTGEPALAALAAKVHVLPVTLVLEEAEALRKLILAKLRR